MSEEELNQQEADAFSSPVQWPVDMLMTQPGLRLADGFESMGLRGCFYEGMPWQGKPTEIFAWVGLPDHASSDDPVPGVVLIHGGGGTAFDYWAKQWLDRGYAVLALDHCGGTAGGTHANRPRHENSGPPGCGDISKSQLNDPYEDQWMYHAVAAVMRGHSLLAALPEVDADRIGVVGVSWGAVILCNAIGLDPRFKFAVPIYGCAYLGGANAWPEFLCEGNEASRKWMQLWDPSHRLPEAKCPVLWTSWVGDFAFSLGAQLASAQTISGPSLFCNRVEWSHNHEAPLEATEALDFADALVKDGVWPTVIGAPAFDADHITVSYDSVPGIREATLVYTRDRGPWQERAWHTKEAEVNKLLGYIETGMPDNISAAYFNLLDEEGRLFSSELMLIGRKLQLNQEALRIDSLDEEGKPVKKQASIEPSAGGGLLGDVIA